MRFPDAPLFEVHEINVYCSHQNQGALARREFMPELDEELVGIREGFLEKTAPLFLDGAKLAPLSNEADGPNLPEA
jgi:hypothetical protein